MLLSSSRDPRVHPPVLLLHGVRPPRSPPLLSRLLCRRVHPPPPLILLIGLVADGCVAAHLDLYSEALSRPRLIGVFREVPPGQSSSQFLSGASSWTVYH